MAANIISTESLVTEQQNKQGPSLEKKTGSFQYNKNRSLAENHKNLVKQENRKKRLTRKEVKGDITSLTETFVKETRKICGNDIQIDKKLKNLTDMIEKLTLKKKDDKIKNSRKKKELSRTKRLRSESDDIEHILKHNLESQGFGDAWSGFKKLPDSLDKFTEVMMSFSTKEELMAKIEEMLSSVTNTSESANKLVKISLAISLMAFIVILAWIVDYVNDNYESNKNWRTTAVAMGSAMSLGLILFGLPQWVTDLVTKITSLFSDNNEGLQNQSAGRDAITPTALTLLFGGLSYLHGHTEDPTSHYKKFMETSKNLANFHRMSTSLSGFTHGLKDFFEKSVNYVRTDLFGIRPIRFGSVGIDEIEEWLDHVDAVQKTYEDGKLEHSDANAQQVFDLRRQYRKFQVKFSAKEWKEVSHKMADHKKILDHLYTRFEDINFGQGGPRMEPRTILLQGVPGTGKSSVMYALATALLPFVLTPEQSKLYKPEHMDKYIYQFSVQTTHYSGYTNQPILIMDEIFAAKWDKMLSTNEGMAIMRLCNIFPFRAPMAKLEDKDNTFVVPKIIIMSTNHTESLQRVVEEQLWFPEAFNRRVERYTIAPLVECAENPTEHVSKWKFRKDQAMDFNNYDFYKSNDIGKIIDNKPPWNWKHFIDMNGEDVQRRIRHFNEYIALLHTEAKKAFELARAGTHYVHDEKLFDTFKQHVRNQENSETFFECENQSGDSDSSDKDESEISTTGGCLERWLSVDEYSDIEEIMFCEEVKKLPSIREVISTWNAWNNNYLSPDDIKDLADYVASNFCKDISFWQVVRKDFQRMLSALKNRVDNAKEFLSNKETLVSDKVKKHLEKVYDGMSKERKQLAIKKLEFTSWATELKKKMFDYIKSIEVKWPSFDTIKQVLLWIGIGAGMLGGIRWAVGRLNNREPKIEVFGEVQSGEKSNNAKQHKSRYRVPIPAKTYENQSMSDGTSKALWIKANTKNSVIIFYKRQGQIVPISLGAGFFIYKTTLLFPYHYLLNLREKINSGEVIEKISIEAIRTRCDITINTSDFMEAKQLPGMEVMDLCCLTLDEKKFEHRADMRGCFISEKSLKDVRQLPAFLATFEGTDETDHVIPMPIKTNVTLHSHCQVPQGDTEITTSGIATYKINTRRGDCGSLLFVDSSKILSGKIMGMHIAGSPRDETGVSILITREHIDKWFPALENQMSIEKCKEIFHYIFPRAIKPRDGVLVGDITYNVKQHLKDKHWNKELIDDLTSHEISYMVLASMGYIPADVCLLDLVEWRNRPDGGDPENYLQLIGYLEPGYTKKQIQQLDTARFKSCNKAIMEMLMGKFDGHLPDYFFGRHDFATYVRNCFGSYAYNIIARELVFNENKMAGNSFTNGVFPHPATKIASDLGDATVNGAPNIKSKVMSKLDSEDFKADGIFFVADGETKDGRLIRSEPFQKDYVEHMDKWRKDNPITDSHDNGPDGVRSIYEFFKTPHKLEAQSATTGHVYRLPIKGKLVIKDGSDEYNKLMTLDTTKKPAWPHLQPVNVVGSCLVRLIRPSKTNILKSKLYEAWSPAHKKPAHLKPITVDGKVLDPITRGVKKYSPPKINLDDRVIAEAAQNVNRVIRNDHPIVSNPGVLTFEQAVIGLEGECLKGITRGTSPGYPFSYLREGKSGKTYWFGTEEVDFKSPEMLELREEVDWAIRMMKLDENVNPGHYCVDTLKDENRPKAKVDAGKTRLFQSTNLVNLIIARMYLGRFTEYFQRYRIANQSAVGINPYSEEWHRLYHWLADKGWQGFDGDFSEYDAHQASIIHEMNLKYIIEPFYENADEEDRRVRRNILFTTTHSLHITNPDFTPEEAIDILTNLEPAWTPSQEEVRNFINNNHKQGAIVYQLESCMPSGSYLTTTFNTLYQLTVSRLAFIIGSKQPAWYALNIYNENVRTIGFGDDGMHAVSPEVSEWFNQHTVPAFYRELGMTFTPATKGDEKELPKTRPIDQLQFLKRGFRYEKLVGRWVAPLELDTILEMPYWTKKSVDPDEITRTNIDNALEELSLHGLTVFDKYAPVMISKSVEHLNYMPKSIGFETLLSKVTMRDLY